MQDLRKVLVCSSCFCASCWHGEFYCQDYKKAGLVEKTVDELNALNREHPSHYSIQKINKVCGTVKL